MQESHARIMRAGLSRAFFLLAFAVMPLPAHADPVRAGITAAITTGTTNRSNSSSAVPVIPVPLLSVRVPFNRFELFAEGIPPIGPVPYNLGRPPGFYFVPNNLTFSQSTKLSYGYAAVRYHVDKTLTLGIGQTLYNQQTTQMIASVWHGGIRTPGGYVPTTVTNERRQIDTSRVPGMRYEAQAAFLLGRMTLTAALALTPTMHAVIHECLCTRTTQTSALGTHSYSYALGYTAPETASEVDASLGVSHRIGRFKLAWGLRYLNYIARYDSTHNLADRNTLVLPFIGVERAFEREPATR